MRVVLREFGVCIMSEIVLFALFGHRVLVDSYMSGIVTHDMVSTWPVDLFFHSPLLCCYFILFYFEEHTTYVVGSKSFWPDQFFKVTEIKQLCYFST